MKNFIRITSLAFTLFFLIGNAFATVTEEQIKDAIFWGHTSRVKRLVAEFGVNTPIENNGSTLLHYAIFFGRHSVVKELIRQGANIEATNSRDETPLMYAASSISPNLSIIRSLVDNGANVNYFNSETDVLTAAASSSAAVTYLLSKGAIMRPAHCTTGRTLISSLAGSGNLSLLRRLSESLPSYIDHAGRFGRTPLMEAIQNGHLQTVRYLLSQNPDLSVTDESGENALIYAVRRGDRRILQALLDVWTGDLNIRTPRTNQHILAIALRQDDIRIMEMLIAKGADPNYPSMGGVFSRTLMEDVIFWGENSFLPLILRHSNEASINLGISKLIERSPTPENRRMFSTFVTSIANPSQEIKDRLFVASGTFGDRRTMDRLIRAGANIDARDSATGNTALLRATQNGDHATVSYLLGKGASFRERNNEGETVVHLAAEQGTIASLRAIKRAGADMDVHDQDGNTPLMVAIRNNRAEAVQFLLSNGASSNYQNSVDQQTPLHLAIRSENPVILNAVISGANLEARNRQGQTPLYVAIYNRDVGAIDLLLRNCASLENLGASSTDVALLNSQRRDRIAEVLRVIESHRSSGRCPASQ